MASVLGPLVPPTTDMQRLLQYVGFVPQPDSCTAAYSDYFDHFVGADFLEQRFNAHRFMGSDDQV
jgi:hypothetical protein